MKQYKEKLKMTTILMVVAMVVILAFYIFLATAELEWINNDPTWDGDALSRWRNLCIGCSACMLGTLTGNVIRNVWTLRDEEKLKAAYVKENDERNKQIWASARAAGVEVFLLLAIPAICIAGYFNITVALTISGCMLAVCLLSLVFSIYYSIKL